MARRVSPNHKKKETRRIAALDASALLNELRNAAAGDDYDGCFTPDGWITYLILLKELKARLIVFGFLPDTFIWDGIDN